MSKPKDTRTDNQRKVDEANEGREESQRIRDTERLIHEPSRAEQRTK